MLHKFTVKCWNEKQKSNDEFGKCWVDVLAEEESDAEKKAIKLCKRDNYLVTNIIEGGLFSACPIEK